MKEKKHIDFIREVSVSKLNNSEIYEVWLLDEEGERIKQVCGYPKKGTPKILLRNGLKKDLICNKSPGFGTIHKGVGFCDSHERGTLTTTSRNFLEIARVYSENNSLSDILKEVELMEIKATDVVDEIKMLTALQLQLMEWIDDTEDVDGRTWNPIRVSMMVNILREIIKSKESAARIEGSMRLELNTLQQVVEMIMSFLVKELNNLNIPRDKVTEILHKMTEEVFVPLTNQSMISDRINVEKLKVIDA